MGNSSSEPRTGSGNEKNAGMDATDAWVRFYKDQRNIPKSHPPSLKLSQYNEFFLQKIAGELIRRLQSKRPIRIWSAGSGIDYVSLKLKDIYGDSVEITVFDISEECISANKRAFEERRLRADFVVGDLFKSSYSKEYDVVFNTGLLEHFKKEEQEALLEVFSRSLLPGGVYLTYVPCAGGRLYVHCMERMKAKGTWPYGPEVPIATFRGYKSEKMALAEENPFGAVQQLAFVKPAYPLIGRLFQPLTSAMMRFPDVFERPFMRLFGGYGLYARFEKPL